MCNAIIKNWIKRTSTERWQGSDSITRCGKKTLPYMDQISTKTTWKSYQRNTICIIVTCLQSLEILGLHQ